MLIQVRGEKKTLGLKSFRAGVKIVCEEWYVS